MMGTHGAEKHHRSTPAKMVSASMTLSAEDLAASHALRFSPPSPRCLLNPREVASEGGGGKGQNSDHQHARQHLLTCSGCWPLPVAFVDDVAQVGAWDHARSRFGHVLASLGRRNHVGWRCLDLGGSMKSNERANWLTPAPRLRSKPTEHNLAVNPLEGLSSQRPRSGALGACLFHAKHNRRSCKPHAAPSRLNFARADGPPSGATASSTAATGTTAQRPSGRCRAH